MIALVRQMDSPFIAASQGRKDARIRQYNTTRWPQGLSVTLSVFHYRHNSTVSLLLYTPIETQFSGNGRANQIERPFHTKVCCWPAWSACVSSFCAGHRPNARKRYDKYASAHSYSHQGYFSTQTQENTLGRSTACPCYARPTSFYNSFIYSFIKCCLLSIRDHVNLASCSLLNSTVTCDCVVTESLTPGPGGHSPPELRAT